MQSSIQIVMARILIIKLGALGDVVMATSFIRRLQQHHDKDEIHLLTSDTFAPIFQDWPNLNVTAFPRKGFKATLSTLCWMRGNRFDRIYDLQSNDRSRLFCVFSKASVCVGNHAGYPYQLHPEAPYTGQCHIFNRMNEIMASADVEPAEEQVYLPISNEKKEEVLGWLKQQQLLDAPFTIIHAGASAKHPKKCWPYFDQIANKLIEQGIKTVWIGGKEDKAAIRKLMPESGIDACQLFSINQLAELARHARFAITNDSGPMHALSGSGIPVFSFFGPTNHLRNHALGQKQSVITLQSDKVRGKSIVGPEARLDSISCDQALQHIHTQGLLD